MTFDQLSEFANRQVARSWFFVAVLAVIVAWLPALFLLDANGADLMIDGLTNPLSVVLLALLHNSQFRAERAQDDRQDTLEQALAALMRHLARQQDAKEPEDLLQHADKLVESARQATRLASADLPDANGR